MKKQLLLTYDFFQKRKLLFYCFTTALFLLLGFLASRIKVEEDISRMMPNGEKLGQINRIFSQPGFTDRIVVKISGGPDTKPEDLIAVADSFETHLQSGYKNYISGIKSKVSDEAVYDIYKTVYNNLPVYLNEEDYKTIDTLTTTEHVKTAISNDYKILASASGLVLKRMIADDPVGISTIAIKKLQSLQVDDNFDLYDGYIMSKDRKSLMLFITPFYPAGETAKNEILIDGLDKIANELTSATHANIYYFGGTVVAVGNAKQSKQDTILTVSITLVTLLLFIGFFFRRKRVPFIMMLPVLFGGIFSLAIIDITTGSISAIALAAGCIIFGIAINYSLHFFSHYKHCGSIKETISDLLVPLTLGSFTTIGSFFSLMLLKSQILNDFGLFAGLSLVGATVFTLVFLPHFIPLHQENTADIKHESWFDLIPRITPKYNIVLVAIIFLLTILLFPYAMQVSFESDITKLNFMTEKLKKSEKEIEQLQGDSAQTVYIASTGTSMEDALQNNEALLRQLDTGVKAGWVKKYSSISGFLPSKVKQEDRLKRWEQYWTNAKKQELLSNIILAGNEYKFRPAAFAKFDSLINKQYSPVQDTGFLAIKNAFGGEFILSSKGMQTIINPVKTDETKRPYLFDRLQQDTSVVILDKKIITNKFIDIIYNDFNSILAYSSIIVFLALLFSYGRIELTVITFLPMLISWIWILGIMNLFGLRFNIISIIISTFIFGIGDDFSIFITDGLTRKFKEGKETIASHRVSIFLSAGTTIIGLGALILAKHPALHSIAIVSIIGISCVLFVGQIIQPFLYNFFVQNRKEKGLAPWTFISLFLSVFAFTYFVFGAVLLTILGFIIIYLLPFPKKKSRTLFYHLLLSKFVGSLIYIMVNVRKVHINKEQMDFSKPAIIIANHQSFLDILFTVMQHPKLILLTNHWVYNSPVFGKVVRMANYYPVMEGVNPAIDKFSDIVKDGYSIVIFPEGTRSVDGQIKRFHKGAFYLAEKLNLDIVPLLLHGTGDTMRKGDFMLFNGKMTIKYLPRIPQEDKSFGEGYAVRTKNISHYFKEEYEKLRREIESPAYFRQRLITNYIYKEPYLELYPYLEMRKRKRYEAIHKLLPKSGNIAILGCGNGFLNYLLYFLYCERQITGIDWDEEKIDVANNCYSKNEQLNFYKADVVSHVFNNSDAFIIKGFLHHLSMENLEALIGRLAEKLNAEGLIIISQDYKSEHSRQHLIESIKKITAPFNLEYISINEKESENLILAVKKI